MSEPSDCQDEDQLFELDVQQIVRILAAPGEIKQEFALLLAQDEAIRQKQRQKEEQLNLEYIRSHGLNEAEERLTRKRKQESEDEALALALQQEFNQEAERMKDDPHEKPVRSTRRSSRISSPQIPASIRLSDEWASGDMSQVSPDSRPKKRRSSVRKSVPKGTATPVSSQEPTERVASHSPVIESQKCVIFDHAYCLPWNETD